MWLIYFLRIFCALFRDRGIYAFINFIIAGFQYMSAAVILRLYLLLLTAFVLAPWNYYRHRIVCACRIVGQIVFGSATFILSPTIYGPDNKTHMKLLAQGTGLGTIGGEGLGHSVKSVAQTQVDWYLNIISLMSAC